MRANGQDWDRLAGMLVARRAELGYAGKRRAAFARDHGLTHTRTIDDLENARRTNFEDATLAQIERIYGWTPGSIAAVLAGGDPTPMPADRVSPLDPVEQLIQEIYADRAMPDERKQALVRIIRQAEGELRAVRDELSRWRRAG